MHIANAKKVVNARRRVVKVFAFTLIELLVVVAIIVVLIALLVPALSQAKLYSKQTACAANLRGIGSAFLAFSQSNSDGKDVISANITGNYWYGRNSTGTNLPWLANYYGKQSICWCPIVVGTYMNPQNPIDTFDYINNGTCYSYFNSTSTATSATAFTESLTMEVPVDTIMLSESAFSTKTPGVWTYYNGVVCALSGQADLESPGAFAFTSPGIGAFTTQNGHAGVHGVHTNGSANVSWYDGHVTLEQVYCNSTLINGATPSPSLTESKALVKENVGFVTPLPLNTPAATLLANPQANYYYWISKSRQH